MPHHTHIHTQAQLHTYTNTHKHTQMHLYVILFSPYITCMHLHTYVLSHATPIPSYTCTCTHIYLHTCINTRTQRHARMLF